MQNQLNALEEQRDELIKQKQENLDQLKESNEEL